VYLLRWHDDYRGVYHTPINVGLENILEGRCRILYRRYVWSIPAIIREDVFAEMMLHIFLLLGNLATDSGDWLQVRFKGQFYYSVLDALKKPGIREDRGRMMGSIPLSLLSQTETYTDRDTGKNLGVRASLSAPLPSPEEYSLARDALSAIKDDRHRTVYIEHKVEKRTMAEIERETGIPRSTLYAHYLQARKDVERWVRGGQGDE